MKKKILLALSAILLLTLIGFPSYLAFIRKNHIYPREVAKQKFTTPNSHFLNYQGKEIHYVDEGQGFPILMIHGFMGSHHNFEKFADSLKNQFRIIRLDLPGFGMSEFFDPNHGELDLKTEYVNFFKFFIDSLHLGQFHLIGNSMGGMMSWYIAASFPQHVKSLTLLNAAGYDMLNVLDNAAPILQYPFLEPFMRRGLPPSGAKAGLLVCYYNDSLVNEQDALFNNSMHNIQGNLQNAFTIAGSGQYPDTAMIKTIQAPTLIVWGNEDEIIPVDHAQRFKKDIPHAKLLIYQQCGHVPMMEKTSELKKDFLEFIHSIPQDMALESSTTNQASKLN
ncbi:MAG: alpha/beta hydrolase [Bacteroidia bacterium]|nr:alpha/beta hydrolase [Bacteroidia bacterium]